jgi:hypothetical protein
MRTFTQGQKATRQTSVKPTTLGHTRFRQRREVTSIGRLQRTIGNHAVQRMSQTDAEELESSGTATRRFGRDFGGIPIHASEVLPVPGPRLQRSCACGDRTRGRGECDECRKDLDGVPTKLKVGEPGDVYEGEADRITDGVMGMPAGAARGGPPHTYSPSRSGTPGRQKARPPASARPLPVSRGRWSRRYGRTWSSASLSTSPGCECTQERPPSNPRVT